MRKPVPGNTVVYIRLHFRVDEMLTEYAEKNGLRRGTAASRMERRYMDALRKRKPDPVLVTRADLGFTGLEEDYEIRTGRNADGSVLGTGMRLTVRKKDERMIGYLSERFGMSVRDFRTAIYLTYFQSGESVAQTEEPEQYNVIQYAERVCSNETE